MRRIILLPLLFSLATICQGQSNKDSLISVIGKSLKEIQTALDALKNEGKKPPSVSTESANVYGYLSRRKEKKIPLYDDKKQILILNPEYEKLPSDKKTKMTDEEKKALGSYVNINKVMVYISKNKIIQIQLYDQDELLGITNLNIECSQINTDSLLNITVKDQQAYVKLRDVLQFTPVYTSDNVISNMYVLSVDNERITLYNK